MARVALFTYLTQKDGANLTVHRVKRTWHCETMLTCLHLLAC